MAQLKIDLVVDDNGSIVVKKFGGNVAGSLDTAGMSAEKFGKRIAIGGAALAGLVGVAGTVISLVGGKGLQVFTDLEKRMIGVQKTTDFTGAEMEQFGESIRKMPRELPVATSELIDIAGVAGQLGVKGVDNITSFAEVMGKLSLATDVAGAEGAASIARLLNVTGEGVDQLPKFGAVLVGLGNNSAATESEILALATEVGLATSVFAVNSTETLAMGAAMKSLGVRAELGGSVVGRAMRTIEASIAAGGEQIALLSQVTGIAEKDLKSAFGENATNVFQKWLHGVGGMIEGGKTAAESLELFGLKGEEVLKVLPTMAVNTGVFDDALSLANEEVKKGTALNLEAAKAGEALSAQMDIAGNITTEMAASIGEELAPQVKEMITGFREWWAINDKIVTQDIAGAIGELASVVMDNKDNILSLFTGVISLSGQAVRAIGGVMDSINAMDNKATANSLREELGGLNEELYRMQNGWFGVGKSSEKEIDRQKNQISGLLELIHEVEDGSLGKKQPDHPANKLADKPSDKEFIDSWQVKTKLSTAYAATVTSADKKIVSSHKDATDSMVKETKTMGKAEKKIFDKMVKDNAKGAKDVTDSWLESVKLRGKAEEDLEKEQNKLITDRMRLEETTSDEIQRLTLSTTDYKLAKFEEEYEAMVQLAGDDKELQRVLAEYKILKLDEIKGKNSETLAEMFGHWQDFSENTGNELGNFTRDLITGQFESIGDAWEGLWKGMLGTAAQYIGNIVAKFAAAKISDFIVDTFFHSGSWQVGQDETRAVILKDEMVIPPEESKIIRDAFPNGDFAGLAASVSGAGSLSTSGIEKAALSTAIQAALQSAMGFALDPGAMAGGFMSKAGAETFSGIVGDMLGISADTGPFGGSPYSVTGRTMGKASGIAEFGLIVGTAISSITGKVGSMLGDLMGDAIGDRSYESLRDAMESGIMGPAEAIGFAREADKMGVDNTSTLGGVFDGISSAIDAAKSAATEGVADLARALGLTDDGWGNASGGGRDGMAGLDNADAGGYENAMDGHADGYAHTGGYLEADEGRIIAQTGEGVLSKVGMANLSKLNVGEINGDIMTRLLSAIQQLSTSGSLGDIAVKVYVGSKELRDLTIETIRTDPGAQQIIRRVAHV